ncbi:hypothetical protein F4815DRAFT_456338 [Daldinia loculata]|nr:hypothetical protein F4815DRAFT_456338 [Daldinia loculata]
MLGYANTAGSVNKDIVVRLKWGETEYHGRLVSSDSYMNIQLTNAQEFIDQKFTSDLGQILIRCVPFFLSLPFPSSQPASEIGKIDRALG